MAKFRYYITSLMAGSVFGTDDLNVALDHVATGEDWVIDTETGMWLYSVDEDGEVEGATYNANQVQIKQAGEKYAPFDF